MKNWTDTLKSFHLAMRNLGAEVWPLHILAPAQLSEVEAVERELGTAIPDGFRQVLLHYSAYVQFKWKLPNEPKLAAPLRPIISGELQWDIHDVTALHAEYQGWIANDYPNPNNADDQVWHGKFPVMRVGYGDVIAIQTSGEDQAAVFYLSPDFGPLHGFRLANDFQDFLDRCAALGCVGLWDWQLNTFISDRQGGIQVDCPNARLWLSMVYKDGSPTGKELDSVVVLNERPVQVSRLEQCQNRLVQATDPVVRLEVYRECPELALAAGIAEIHKQLACITAKDQRYLVTVLGAFNDPSVLDWIEENVPSSVPPYWGDLAAASGLTWERATAWLDAGQPLSLVAIEGLLGSVNRRSMDWPSLEQVQAVLNGYTNKHKSPRVSKAVQAILEGLPKRDAGV